MISLEVDGVISILRSTWFLALFFFFNLRLEFRFKLRRQGWLNLCLFFVNLSIRRQTLGSRAPSGDWVDGLARAFFCAGARGVICTLTRLEDRRALELMPDIYAVLHERGAIGSLPRQAAARLDAASALRESKLPILNHPALSHPANWSQIAYFGLPQSDG